MNKYLVIAIQLLLIFISWKPLKAQEFFKKINYQAQIGTTLSTSGETPLWLRSNQYGGIPSQSQFISLGFSAHKEYDSTKKNNHISYGYGINTIVNIGKINQILQPEIYVKVKFKSMEVYAGRRKEIFGLVDSTLSSGSYIWSGNALPIPKIQFSIPDYQPVICKGLISLKGNFAHGYFGNQGFVKNFYLHQKTIYGRLGKPNWKLKLYSGFNHQVVYGGTETYNENGQIKIKTYPSDFQSYIWLVSGYSINRVSDDKKGTLNPDDAYNRIGNHLGSIDFGLEMLIEKSKIMIYRQNFYDDGSLFYMNNITDGLTGISFIFKNSNAISSFKFKKILVEYFNSTSQGGDKLGGTSTVPQLRGLDDYFNNYTSWTYNDNIIGTPLFTTNKVKNINNLRQIYVYDNYVKSIHFATNFSLNKANVTLILNQSQHLTTKIKQFSSLINISYPVKKYDLNCKLALDNGSFWGNNFGLQLNCLRKF